MFRKQTSEEYASTEKAIQEYLDFTASPTRTREKRTEDYYQISQMEGLVDFGTNGKDMLIAQTQVITIEDPKTNNEHEIGSFLIYIIRSRRKRMWEVDFRFHNTTRVVENVYLHPHIKVSDYKSIPIATGYLCIQRGQHGVYQAIREARIPDALSQLVSILYMFQSRPFRQLERWPLARTKI